jgi:hypothetical protein
MDAVSDLGVEEHPVKASSRAAGITIVAVSFSVFFFMGLFPVGYELFLFAASKF